jgi:two-component system, NarL family, response regulator LiaR
MDNLRTAAGDRIRVLIVDDHAMVRQGLRAFLELQDRSALPIEVVGEAANGKQAIDLACRTRPDVVLLDLVMPEVDGIQATSGILECSPGTRVIILTSFGEEDRILPAVRAGAQGYLLKDIPPEDLVQAIRQVYLGQVQLHPEVAKKLMAALAARKELPAQQAAEELTPRELDVLQLISEGCTNRLIAEKLVISEKTVKTHVSSILGKLHLEDRTQAAVYALRHGTVPGSDGCEP